MLYWTCCRLYATVQDIRQRHSDISVSQLDDTRRVSRPFRPRHVRSHSTRTCRGLSTPICLPVCVVYLLLSVKFSVKFEDHVAIRLSYDISGQNFVTSAGFSFDLSTSNVTATMFKKFIQGICVSTTDSLWKGIFPRYNLFCSYKRGTLQTESHNA